MKTTSKMPGLFFLTICLLVSLTGLQAEITLDPGLLDFVIDPPTESQQQPFAISNSGPYPVNYSLSLENFSYPGIYSPYIWYDSNHSNGPQYKWEEISETGTLLDVSREADGYEAVALPFAFPYYGKDYNTITVSSNGYIAPGDVYTTYHDAVPLPNSSVLPTE